MSWIWPVGSDTWNCHFPTFFAFGAALWRRTKFLNGNTSSERFYYFLQLKLQFLHLNQWRVRFRCAPDDKRFFFFGGGWISSVPFAEKIKHFICVKNEWKDCSSEASTSSTSDRAASWEALRATWTPPPSPQSVWCPAGRRRISKAGMRTTTNEKWPTTCFDKPLGFQICLQSHTHPFSEAAARVCGGGLQPVAGQWKPGKKVGRRRGRWNKPPELLRLEGIAAAILILESLIRFFFFLRWFWGRGSFPAVKLVLRWGGFDQSAAPPVGLKERPCKCTSPCGANFPTLKDSTQRDVTWCHR